MEDCKENYYWYPGSGRVKSVYLGLNLRERRNIKSLRERDKTVPDHTPGAFRLRVVFELVYTNSPIIYRSVKLRV